MPQSLKHHKPVAVPAWNTSEFAILASSLKSAIELRFARRKTMRLHRPEPVRSNHAGSYCAFSEVVLADHGEGVSMQRALPLARSVG